MRERILVLPTLAFVLMCLVSLFAVPVFAQDGETPPVDPIDWLTYAALAINAVIVPIVADLLKRVWVDAPSLVKTIVPMVIGSFLVIAEAKLLEVFGTPIDLSLIEEILLGGGGGMASTVAFKFGETHGRGG